MYKMLIKNEDHLKFQLKQVDSNRLIYPFDTATYYHLHDILSTEFTADYHTLQVNYNKCIMF